MNLQGTLGVIDGVASTIASVGAGIPGGLPVAVIAGFADYFLKIAIAAVKAHEAVTGKPFDPTLLKHEDLVP
jgi:hypothetical protein